MADMEYKKLTLDMMAEYVLANHEEDKDWFKGIALKEVKDKDGNVIGHNRNTISAKKAFYEKYKDEINFTDRQPKAKPKKKDKLVESILNW